MAIDSRVDAPSVEDVISTVSQSSGAASTTDREIEPPTNRIPASVLGMERGDRRFLSVASVIALLLMGIHWLRLMGWQPAPTIIERPNTPEYRFVLEINSASWVEWIQLEGIGEALGRRIVEDRESNGPFPDIESLQRVPGIGPKTLDRIRPHLRIASDNFAED